MLHYILTALDYASFGRVHFYWFAFTFILFLWLAKYLPATVYRNFQASADDTHRASVVIPVFDEPVHVFRAVVRNIVTQHPHEVIVVINGPEQSDLLKLCKEFPGVTVEYIETASKRLAIKRGVEKATGGIIVLVDSDTIWANDTLTELLKPFSNEKIGGVTTHQEVFLPERSYISRFANWIEIARTCSSLPAMSVFGQVGCLPGRTIAFRKKLLENCLDDFINHRFLDVHLDISDDRWLTSRVLMQGYKTVYQRSSKVLTDAPVTIGKFVRQQLRWARGSQYNTLEMTPWMIRHAKYLCCIYWSDILLPFLLVAVFAGWLASELTGGGNLSPGVINLFPSGMAYGLATLGSFLAGSTVRQIPGLLKRPGEIFYLPLHVLTASFLLVPIRIFGFATMCFGRKWGTRNSAIVGDSGFPVHTILPIFLAATILLFLLWLDFILRVR